MAIRPIYNMPVKELLEVLSKCNPEATISTGISTGGWNSRYEKDSAILNWDDIDGFRDIELQKDLSKIKRVIFWGEE